MKKYRNVDNKNNLNYARAKDHVNIHCILEQIADLGANRAILHGPPYSENLSYLPIFCARNTRYFPLKNCRLVVRVVGYP
jgi:hypothetical protein